MASPRKAPGDARNARRLRLLPGRALNPSDTCDVVGEHAQADAAQARETVDAAHAASSASAWALSTPQQRFDVLDAAGSELLARRQGVAIRSGCRSGH